MIISENNSKIVMPEEGKVNRALRPVVRNCKHDGHLGKRKAYKGKGYSLESKSMHFLGYKTQELLKFGRIFLFH